jgi:hypothetical protein
MAERNIAPGDTPTKPTTPKPKPGNQSDSGGLPKLTEKLRNQLEKRFDDEGDFGTRAGPTEAAVRRLMRQGLAAGLTEKEAGNFLHPAFYRGAADPYGGGKLFKDLTPEQLKALSEYAGKQSGSGLGGHGSATASQAAFFEAFPDLQQKYISLANSYNQAPNLTDGMSTTPPGAVLGSDGKWHDPNKALPEGVTLPEGTDYKSPFGSPGPSSTPGGATAETTGAAPLYQPFTQMTPEQSGVPGYQVTPYSDVGSAMSAAQGMLANHYASAAAAGDFDAAGKAFGALQQHQEYAASQITPTPGPESFSEQDLYQETQYR